MSRKQNTFVYMVNLDRLDELERGIENRLREKARILELNQTLKDSPEGVDFVRVVSGQLFDAGQGPVKNRVQNEKTDPLQSRTARERVSTAPDHTGTARTVTLNGAKR